MIQVHAAAASPGGYVDDAADALATANVYVSSEVASSAQLRAVLEEHVGDASIGVAVFSDNAALEASNSEILQQLAEQTSYDTIIIAVGDDLSAGSYVLEQGEAPRIANEAETSAGSLEDALVATVDEVVAVSGTGPDLGGGFDAGPLIGVVVAVAVVVAGIATLIAVRRARRRSRAARGVPAEIRPRIASLRELTGAYAAAGSAGNGVALQTSQRIAALATNVEELFVRLARGRDGSQVGIAAVEYGDKLRKLTAALEREYLLDILTHPNLWDDPAERVREVQSALDAVSHEVVENIKQVNARRALHFQVSLDGLMGGRKELQDWQCAFDAAGDEQHPPRS
ncbi:hypothetical protein [Microbacterium thalassium]|uniref:TPM domain-containing protein n=1 Tax=Microbacterium thalassium TaxID=362649 RepID=A0A7X0FPI8_9MICO|nr:hypothetical protein [Microbacterium thalassium]MBB6390742.1 hypothetical protein [Microbacterium thalassium]GLK25850.1 hypothetical protein GCM10017607_31690 [Microbacterium thalassium]